MMEVTAFAIFMGLFAIGDLVSTKSDAKLPSLFVIAVLTVAGYWSGMIPLDLFETTGISITLVYLIYYLQLANMGALIPKDDMIAQWRTIIIAAAGLIGIVIGALLIGGLIFGKEAAIVGAAPLSGGIVAYEIMRDGATSIGRTDLAIMALAVYVLQSFVGYPLTTFLLKKEALRLRTDFRSGNIDKNSQVSESREVEVDNVKSKKKTLLPQLPEKFITTNTVLFKLAITALIGILITNVLNSTFKPDGPGDFISRYVVLLIVGVVLSEIGFLDKNPSKKSQISGFVTITIIGFSVISGLASATPEIVFAMIGPTVGIIITGLVGLVIFSAIVGKLLGYSKEMSIGLALSALYGYPATEILSNESCRVIAETQEEFEYLLADIQPKMIVSGFVTVTIGSVLIAGFLVNFL